MTLLELKEWIDTVPTECLSYELLAGITSEIQDDNKTPTIAAEIYDVAIDTENGAVLFIYNELTEEEYDDYMSDELLYRELGIPPSYD